MALAWIIGLNGLPPLSDTVPGALGIKPHTDSVPSHGGDGYKAVHSVQCGEGGGRDVDRKFSGRSSSAGRKASGATMVG